MVVGKNAIFIHITTSTLHNHLGDSIFKIICIIVFTWSNHISACVNIPNFFIFQHSNYTFTVFSYQIILAGNNFIAMSINYPKLIIN